MMNGFENESFGTIIQGKNTLLKMKRKCSISDVTESSISILNFFCIMRKPFYHYTVQYVIYVANDKQIVHY